MSRRTVAVAAAGALLLLALLLTPNVASPDHPGRADGWRQAGELLRGDGPSTDLAQDVVGARALLDRTGAYPRLGDALPRLGLKSTAEHRSTHPPTAFVLVLPVAKLRWPTAAAIWAWAMLAAIAVSIWALGFPALAAAALAVLAVVWPPAAWSLGQLTPLWLLGGTLAWRWRDRPRRAGAAIGLAVATKLTPVVLLAPFVRRRRIAAVATAAVTVGALVLVVLALDPGAASAYLRGGQNARLEADRRDNGAPVLVAYHRGGVGAAAAAALIVVALALLVLHRRRDGFGEWAAWMWISVALLPLVWIYSLLPLLPGLVWCTRRGNAAAVLAVVAVALPFAFDPFGNTPAVGIACTVFAAGGALVLASPRSRRPSDSAAAA